MASLWKRPASSLILSFAAALAATALSFPSPAAAAGCPTTPVAEDGGLHWCYKHDNTKGDVHLWKSPGYDASTAVLVIYIHGLDLKGVNNGADSCHLKRPYVDCIWDANDHAIRHQFAASGVNGLFVAVEGGPETYPLWGSLSSLVSSIQSKGNIAPPKSVTIIGHSAGMYTVRGFINDPSVRHVVDLDWVKDRGGTGLADMLSTWIAKGGDRKLTLVGGSSTQQGVMDTMSASIPCNKAASPASLTQSEIDAKCLYMRTSTNHMQVVLKGTFIPQAIKRSSSAAAGPAAPSSPSGDTSGASGPTTRTQQDGTINAPLLEIPIPNVDLTAAVRTEGVLTIPWIAQYVGGVYTFLLSIAGMLAAVMMVVGGFQYVTSAGDKGRLAAGKQRIVNALTGLILAFGSYTVLYAINPNLVSFDGLKIVGVNAEINEDHDPGNDVTYTAQDVGGSVPPDVPGVPNAPRAPGAPASCDKFAKGAVAYCTRNAGDCPEWCRKLSADVKSWPSTIKPWPAPGYMPTECTIPVPDHSYNGRIVLVGNGGRSHPKVVEALKATAEQMAKDYPDKKYAIKIGECHRTIESQILKVCAPGVGIKQKGGHDVDYGSAVANPGGSNHGVGYACDLHLLEGNKDLFEGHYSTSSQCSANTDYMRLFDKIMFRMGWVRYDRELWHYEYGTPAGVGNRCGGANNERGDCSYPPEHYCGKK